MALKLNLIYNQFGAGWTETFYVDAVSDPFTYINGLSATLWSRTLDFRSAGTVLYGIRASVVGSSRLSYTKILNLRADGPDLTDPVPDYSYPDIVSTDAVYQLVGAGGVKRAIALRGLRDRDVVRIPNGVFAPSSNLERQVQSYFSYLKGLSWAIRYEARPNALGLIWYPILSVTPVALNNALSVLEPSIDPFTFVQPVAVTIQGVPKDDLPGLPSRAVVVSAGTSPRQIVIRYRYRAHTAFVYPLKMRLTLTQYLYATLSSATFVRFSERKTGRSFGQPRGRARVAIRQY